MVEDPPSVEDAIDAAGGHIMEMVLFLAFLVIMGKSASFWFSPSIDLAMDLSGIGGDCGSGGSGNFVRSMNPGSGPLARRSRSFPVIFTKAMVTSAAIRTAVLLRSLVVPSVGLGSSYMIEGDRGSLRGVTGRTPLSGEFLAGRRASR